MNSVNFYSLIALALIVGHYLFHYGVIKFKREILANIPTLKPPENLSPSAMRFLVVKSFDHKGFIAMVMQLAVKNYIKINVDKNIITLSQVFENKQNPCDDEQVLLDSLFPYKHTLVLDQKNRDVIKKSMVNMRSFLRAKLFKKNLLFPLNVLEAGICFTLITLLMISMMQPHLVLQLMAQMFLAAGIFAYFETRYFTIGIKRSLAKVLVTAVIFFAAQICFGLLIDIGIYAEFRYDLIQSLPTFLILDAMFFVHYLAYYYLRHMHTEEGYHLISAINGFNQSLAEKESSVVDNFPYAVALGANERYWDQLNATPNIDRMLFQPYFVKMLGEQLRRHYFWNQLWTIIRL